ncbi:MAG: hypothetical protein PHI12_11290 [Dehalococcoidales bacterium]|nr:hypothetical protein [Dehalococcoidales bacterium]
MSVPAVKVKAPVMVKSEPIVQGAPPGIGTFIVRLDMEPEAIIVGYAAPVVTVKALAAPAKFLIVTEPNKVTVEAAVKVSVPMLTFVLNETAAPAPLVIWIIGIKVAVVILTVGEGQIKVGRVIAPLPDTTAPVVVDTVIVPAKAVVVALEFRLIPDPLVVVITIFPVTVKVVGSPPIDNPDPAVVVMVIDVNVAITLVTPSSTPLPVVVVTVTAAEKVVVPPVR